MGGYTAAMPHRYRLALFDFDGTLADSFGLFSEVYDTLAIKHGFRTLAPEERRALRSMHARDVMKQVGMPAWKLPMVAAEFIGIMRERRARVRLFPGTVEALTRLGEAGVVIAVVSSNARDNVEAILGPEASAMVSHFACGMSIFGKRSHLREALAKTGAKASEAIYIGDQASDLEAARDEGIDFGAVAWGYGAADHLESLGAAFVFRSMDDIIPR